MGSISGALTSHLQLSHCRFSARTSHSQLASARIGPTSRRSKLRFSSLLSRRNFNRFVCSAVDDDVREKQMTDLGGGNRSTVVEDVPDIGESSTNGAPEKSDVYNFLYPSKDLLPDDKEMSVFDHLEELRQRIFVSVLAVGAAILGCFAFSKELVLILEAPVKEQGVRFLQLGPGEFFFTTLKVSGYCGLLLGSPVILYEIIAFVLPGLTRAERRFLGPIVLGSSVLFYAGIAFSYIVLTPAALNFFVSYAEGAVESLWSIDQYFEFVLVLMFSTGLSFQVPVIQILLGQLGLVSGDQMLSIWRYVVVGAVVAAAVLTPSTDPLTQVLLAAPLLGLYLGGAWVVKLSGR
ncbi:sec-independent protein translocase protein TATC, chloroplastic [Cucurbita pepo subsp. pepo]|uniref:sec-independent protein translocase protein TATC, chloroplastic n=1 Tax=Cucurbita pepo subsp. pepo TaxID=3664 RepID=UPI000C9D272B|nr:sec-independent protein translocase protein TATC, chloroplastic [Cucurbita pepo subsp. pepo]